MKPAERVCLALDFPTRAEVLAAAKRFSGRVGWLKIGLEAFAAEGPALVGDVAAHGPRVFLDLKFHDIPATVERAVAAAARSGAAMINVHAFGGRAMLEAARRGMAATPSVKLIAVTLLTSLDPPALADLPIAGHPEGIVRRLSLLARDCGLDGVVCGHIHKAEIREVGGVLYCNDGDWVESCTALVEHLDGRLEIVPWIELRGFDPLHSRDPVPRPVPERLPARVPAE